MHLQCCPPTHLLTEDTKYHKVSHIDTTWVDGISSLKYLILVEFIFQCALLIYVNLPNCHSLFNCLPVSFTHLTLLFSILVDERKLSVDDASLCDVLLETVLCSTAPLTTTEEHPHLANVLSSPIPVQSC